MPPPSHGAPVRPESTAAASAREPIGLPYSGVAQFALTNLLGPSVSDSPLCDALSCTGLSR